MWWSWENDRREKIEVWIPRDGNRFFWYGFCVQSARGLKIWSPVVIKPSFFINEISGGYKRCRSCQNFQYSRLNTARSKPNSPPHKVTSARLSFKALSKSFLAARAAGISVIRPAWSSSLQLCETHQIMFPRETGGLTWIACVMSESMMARKSAISPSSSHWRPMVARTIVTRSAKLEKPIPAPKSERARVTTSCRWGKGVAGVSHVCLLKNT